jgi:uncharacterized membrane protein YeaQ/YmgE (transglycosylase-associated protein family)
MWTDPQLAQAIQDGLHELLVWVGFGTLVGLTGKAILPGRDPGGTVATLMVGIAGSVIGCGTLLFFRPDAQVTPISPLGFVCATVGAFVLLLFYRILSGSLFAEVEDGERWLHRYRRRRRSRRLVSDV